MTDNILAPIAALALPDSGALAGRAQQILSFIQGFQITDPDTYLLAADELQAVKARAKLLEDQRTAITGPLNAATKAVNDLFRGPATLLASAESTIKSKMLGWQQEQDRIAAAARAKAEAEAAAERKRLADEAAARQREAEAQQRAAAVAQAAGDAQAAQVAVSAAQRAAAEAQTAAATSQMVVAAPVAPPVAKVAGISTSTKVNFQVLDLQALVKHIAQHPELTGLLTVDAVKLRAYVRGLGLAASLPGVNVFEDKVLSARAA